MSLYLGSSSGIASNLLLVPLSIILGVLSGIAAALLLKFLCKTTKNPLIHCFLVLTTGVGMRILEELKILKINSLIGVMVMGFVISNYCEKELGTSLKETLGKVWQVGQIYLFTLVGTAINPTLIGNLIIPGTLAIMSALVIRSIGDLDIASRNRPNIQRKAVLCYSLPSKGYCSVCQGWRATSDGGSGWRAYTGRLHPERSYNGPYRCYWYKAHSHTSTRARETAKSFTGIFEVTQKESDEYSSDSFLFN